MRQFLEFRLVVNPSGSFDVPDADSSLVQVGRGEYHSVRCCFPGKLEAATRWTDLESGL